MKIHNAIAIVTGAGGHLGRAIAVKLAQLGSTVIINFRIIIQRPKKLYA